MKRIARWCLGIGLLGAALYVGISWVLRQRLTGAHPSSVGAVPSDFPYAVESIRFSTTDGQTLSGWLSPADDRKKAIILLHGFTGNRKQMLPRARFFRAQGYTVLLYDARASGESTGDAITFGYRERADLITAIKLLNERGHEKIACLGVSQGGATILFAAEDLCDVKCVICESVYDDMAHAVDRRMRHYTGMPSWLGAQLIVAFAEQRLDLSIDDVKPVQHIAKLPCPVFLISGTEDTRTWPEDTERLFAAAREPKELWMIEGAKHEDLFHLAGYTEKVQRFLHRHLE